MSNHLLSQEEIDALLKKEPVLDDASELSPGEIDALGEIGNIAMGTAATTLSQIIGRRVRITTPNVSVIDGDTFSQAYPMPHLTVEVRYNLGLEGLNLFVIQTRDAHIIAQLMLGQEPEDGFKLDDMRLSAIGEAMNQMMGSAATAISTMFDRVVTILPPSVELIDLGNNTLRDIFTENNSIETSAVKVSFSLSIEGLVDSEIMQLLPISFAKNMVKTLLETMPVSSEHSTGKISPREGPWEKGLGPQPVEVQPVQFAPLKPKTIETNGGKNMELLLDIPLQVSVELGRTKRLLKEILELGVGSILELDNLAGEPVNILVNGTLVAHGEVVVIGENFGVQVTGIVGLRERVKTLQ